MTAGTTFSYPVAAKKASAKPAQALLAGQEEDRHRHGRRPPAERRCRQGCHQVRHGRAKPAQAAGAAKQPFSRLTENEICDKYFLHLLTNR